MRARSCTAGTVNADSNLARGCTMRYSVLEESFAIGRSPSKASY